VTEEVNILQIPRQRPVAETIEVVSLAGEVLCTLDGSAKLSTVLELKLLIQARTGICVACQELLNGTERLSDRPVVDDARPLAKMRGPITISVVRGTLAPLQFSDLVDTNILSDGMWHTVAQRSVEKP